MSDVQPREMAGKPQLHLSKMRLQDTYEVTSNDGKKKLKASRILKYD
jgi:hypothetical protein